MIQKEIIYFGRNTVVACDEKCEKAWGINIRPKIQITEDDDDFAYLADHELGIAPEDPGTYEGGVAKPELKEDRLNKWCVRECERCYMHKLNRKDESIVLKDFGKRVYNIPRD